MRQFYEQMSENGLASMDDDEKVVGAVGLEPTCPKTTDFKSVASANSATLP